MAAEGFFTWGAGGSKLTPEQIAIARQLLMRKKMQGADTSPVQSWTQGAARVADALGDVIQEKRLNGQEKDLTDYNNGLISNLLSGGGASSAGSIPSPGAAGEISNTAPAGDPSYRDAIASIESDGSGGYSAVGPTNPKLGRALGRYQIMEANIGPWSQEALGRTVTPDEFLANPQLQDAIFDKKFGSYVQQYGPEGASQAWFAGPGGVGKLDRRDSLGTSVAAYSDKFNRALGGGRQVASLDPAAGISQPPMPAPEAQAQIQGSQPSASPLPPAATVAAPPPVASVPVVAPTPAPAPNTQVAQDVSGPALANAIKVLSDPRANENTKAIAQLLVRQAQARQQAILEQNLKQSDPGYQADLKLKQLQADQIANPRLSPADEANIGLNRDKFAFEKESSQLTPDIKEYKFAKENGYTGSFAQYQIDMKKSAANNTTINTGEGNKFYNTLDEKNAGIFSGLSDTGIQARSTLGQIDALDNILKASPTGWVGAMKQAAGEYGINTEGLSDIQAATALINKMVPTQRQPGSGTMSDADLALFKQSLPRIINQPGGNATIINTIRGISQYQVQMGEIADRVANRELSPAEGRAAIAALPNPLSGFKAPPPGKEEEGWTAVPTDVPGVTIRRKN